MNQRSDNMHTEPSRSIPELRFPEFDGKWEEIKYGDIYSFHSTNSFSRDCLNYERGGIKNIHYGDIHTKFPTIFDINKENVPFINPDIDLTKVKEENYCCEGDLVIADASEDYADIGKTIELKVLNNENVLAGLHTFLARPKKNTMAIGYAGYLMQSWKVRKQVMTIAQGTKVLGLSTGRMSKIKLNLPSFPEQQKIASFLTAVDDKITQLSKKAELLEQYKKGVMQRIFSEKSLNYDAPDSHDDHDFLTDEKKSKSSQKSSKSKFRLRFKDENGKEYPEWEEKKLGEVTFKVGKKNKGNVKYPIYSINNQVGFIPQSDQFEGMDSNNRGYDISMYKIIGSNTWAYNPARINVGSIGFSGELDNIIISSLYVCFKTNEDLEDSFLKYYLQTYNFNKAVLRNVEGGVRDYLFYENFSSIIIPLPSNSEQQKIASFLTSIDRKIEQVNTQLEKAKTWKKGLLQKMFV